MILYGDLETYSETPITHGTYRYAEDSEVLLFSYAVDEGPVSVWDLTETPTTMPGSLQDALALADSIVIHNSMFDRTVLRYSRNLRLDIPIRRWHDTMVCALAHSLPGSLEKLCDVLSVHQDKRKLATGKALIQLFCKPRPKNMKLRRATQATHPVEWAQFVEYARYDIEAMREVYKKCPRWNYHGEELELWWLDQQINDRGVHIDTNLLHAAIRTVKREQAKLKEQAADNTAGWLESTTKRDKMLEYILMEYGVALPDMRKDTLDRRVNDPNLPEELRELLAIRLQACTTSTSKYSSVARGINADGRLRGLLQFCGASRTGRWAGRRFQPQNLPRPTTNHEEIEENIAAVKIDALDLLVDNTMRAVSDAIRGLIAAPPGKKLVVSDLANIEGRKAAWLAGEEWKLEAFREYDTLKTTEGWITQTDFRDAILGGRRGDFTLVLDEKRETIHRGPDLYKLAYAHAFAIAVDEVTKDQRQIGKVMELMLQYGGGVGAFITGATTYNIDLNAMAAAALPNIPKDVLAEATEFFEWTVKKNRTTFGLDRDTFIVCDSLKRLWRRAHPGIASYWSELEETTRQAINNPSRWLPARRVDIRRDGAWLKLRLPSGRLLCYPSPQIDEKGAISYMGVNQYSRKWSRLKTYGGKLLENITQASSRDVIAANMPAVEANGYEIVLTIHDEDVTEAPDRPEFNAEHLSAIMATAVAWAEDLPLAAAGYESYRYRKG